jgi:hypothetical protein
MDLVKDDAKLSYTLFTQGKELQPWASHQPVLIHTLNTIKEGKVLEYGMGWHSTQIMHIICGMQDRQLLSVDTDKKWFDKFAEYKSDNHELLYMSEADFTKYDHPLFTEHYSVALIDGAPGEARKEVVKLMRNNVDYFVIHDTEEYANGFRYPNFSYQWDFSGFKHVHHLQKGGPATSLISNLDEINEDLLTLFK